MQAGNYYYCNIHFRRLLIDTGDGQQAEFFLNLKKSINFDKFAITDVILTHWHHDHIGGVGTCSASVGGVMKSAEVSKNIAFNGILKLEIISNTKDCIMKIALHFFLQKDAKIYKFPRQNEDEILLPDNHQYTFIKDG